MAQDGDPHNEHRILPELWPELWDEIFAWLNNDRVSVRSCCAVCTTWLPHAQRYLYPTMQVLDDHARPDGIGQRAPNGTMRLSKFTAVALSGRTLVHHIRRLRVIFSHHDPQAWDIFVAGWTSLPAVYRNVRHIQLHVQHLHNVETLLRIFVDRFPDVTNLDLSGRFAQGRDLARGISSFASLSQLRCEWPGLFHPALLRNVMSAGGTETWDKPPIVTSPVLANRGSLQLLLEWFKTDSTIVLANLSPSEIHDRASDHHAAREAIEACDQSFVKQVIALQVNALNEPLLPRHAHELCHLLRILPCADALIVSIAYGMDRLFTAGLQSPVYNPIASIVTLFRSAGDNLLDLSLLTLQLQIPAADLANNLELLEAFSWKHLDSEMNSYGDRLRIVVSLHVTECITEHSESLYFNCGLRTYIESKLPMRAAAGCVSTAYSEMCPRNSLDMCEEQIVQFANSNFAVPADAYLSKEHRTILLRL